MSRDETEMNCKDYEQALLGDPGFNDESGHVETCADCQKLRSEVQNLDSKLALALEIPVPELVMPELPDIETDNVVGIGSRQPARKPVWYALAASVLVAILVGVQVSTNQTPATLAEQVLAHVDNEASALQPSNTPVSDDKIGRVVPENLATMNHDAGLITYAESCAINGKPVPHLVIQGEQGPITILLMPEESVAEATTLEGVNIKGVILPVGNGSIAIIGDREEQLEKVSEKVLDSVTWST